VIVDAHVHVASPDTALFPRTPTGVGSEWWRTAAAVEDLLAVLDATGVERAVVVQAVGVYGYDCRYAAAATAMAPARLALVGAIDMSTADPSSQLADLARSGDLAGVRVFGVGGEAPAWLGDGRADDVWVAAGELGVSVVPTVFADRLPSLAEVAGRHPDVPVAVDHCGFVDVDDPAQMDLLVSLASVPSVSLKVTSHVLHAAAETGEPARVVDRLMATFGGSRLCWGSDHPQHRSLSYAEMVRLADRAARHLDDDERAQFFHGTATRLWFR
jgi:L-fuconolactonase